MDLVYDFNKNSPNNIQNYNISDIIVNIVDTNFYLLN